MDKSANAAAYVPLAERMRPRSLEDYVGQSQLLGRGKPLANALKFGHLHSCILWGPPGTGKTTLALLLARAANARLEKLSAVLAGVKDIRQVVDRARIAQTTGQATILFVDEIHRFNKAQQDAFLPHLEDGTLTLIGATTENPSFQLNNALLSRARVYVLQRLSEAELEDLLAKVLADTEKGLASSAIHLSEKQIALLVNAADGDGRQLLNLLEMLNDWLPEPGAAIADTLIQDVVSQTLRRFDHHGDVFYDQISALHKSVRGSDPDAALYWFARMIDGGCDPHYIARRLVRMATEDIGNADPRALDIALQAWQAYERLGSPEGELALAQAVSYLACSAKSNAAYVAYQAAMQAVKETGSLDVPMHLRNAPTRLMKALGHGKGYRYAHDEPNAIAEGETYLPAELLGRQFYQPVERGLEIKIAEKLARLRNGR